MLVYNFVGLLLDGGLLVMDSHFVVELRVDGLGHRLVLDNGLDVEFARNFF